MKMEKKIVKAPYQFKEQIVNYYELFGYHLVNQQDILFSRLKLEFESEKVDDKKKSVMDKFPLHPFLTYLPLLLGCGIILILTTLFLVFALGGQDRLTYFLYFMVPVFCLLPLMAVYTYLRFNFDNKNINVLANLNDIRKELEEK